ncbi:hypothetical protein [Actinoplanes sp. NPDC026670]|uniref:hypothetical protein n=1 Tax=Actinoplanes sp. NPDC026670 TaxID=3154700 RepID=UPI0033F8A61C
MFNRFLRESTNDLARDADYQAEQAKHALNDDMMGHAIRWADWTVANTRKVAARRRDDPMGPGVLADRLWDRALIREAMDDISGAIGDASEALAILHESPANDDEALMVPSLDLLLCELHARAGDAEAARGHAPAIRAYEGVTDDYPPLVLADGYGRYGRAMHLIGDPEGGPALRRAAAFYREASIGTRYSAMTYIRLVLLIADSTPVTATEAPQMLTMLRSAAAVARRLPLVVVPPVPPGQARASAAAYTPEVFTEAMVKSRMAEWLAVLREK